MSMYIQLLAILSCLLSARPAAIPDLQCCSFGFRRPAVERQELAIPSLSMPQHVLQLRKCEASAHSIRASQRGVPPPFLRHPFLFGTNSFGLSGENLKVLRASVEWLHIHPTVRVLIVGTCDSSSEVCRPALAEARGQAIQLILDSGGTHGTQIAGVKVWDNLDRQCRSTQTRCQSLERSAWIFIASATAR